ncbi:MAG: hypothetical protein K2P51_02030 [Rhabdochlamydiaceae bacterium]|nr:hypothetical protein [Rhabdochlamydiaceae bacterium]
MTSATHIQSFRGAYEAYKASYHEIKAKGGESLNHYSASEKAYRAFKKIGKELQGQSSHLEPKQKRIVSQVLEKMSQVRHSQKQELKAFNENMSSFFRKGTSLPNSLFSIAPPASLLTTPIPLSCSSSSSASRALTETAQRRMDEFHANQPEIQKAFNALYARALKLIDLDLAALKKEPKGVQITANKQVRAIRAGYETQKNIVKRLMADVSIAYRRAAVGQITSEAELKESLISAVATALNSTRASLHYALESMALKPASTKDFVSCIKSFSQSFMLTDQKLEKIARHKSVKGAKDEFISLTMGSFEANLKALFPQLNPYFPQASLASSSSSAQDPASGFIEQTLTQKQAFESALPLIESALIELLEEIHSELMEDYSRSCKKNDDTIRLYAEAVPSDAEKASRFGDKRASILSEHCSVVNAGYREMETIVRLLVQDISRAYSLVETGKISSEKRLKQKLTSAVAQAIQSTRNFFEKDVVAVFLKNSKTPKEFVAHLKAFQNSLYLSDEDLAKIGNHDRVSSAARDFLEMGVSGFVKEVLRASFPMLSEYFP